LKGSPARRRPTTPPPQAVFIPLFSLGIPSNAVTALLLGSLMMHGVQPGPPADSEKPGDLLGDDHEHVCGERHAAHPEPAPDQRLVRLLKVPYRLLFPLILLFCIIGSYSVNNSRSTC